MTAEVGMPKTAVNCSDMNVKRKSASISHHQSEATCASSENLSVMQLPGRRAF
jgi:hypothetical protein